MTSQRVVFEGCRTTREWLFTNLLGAEASSDDHAVLLHVSNRQKVSGRVLGELGARFQAYLALGVAAGQDGGPRSRSGGVRPPRRTGGKSPIERHCPPAETNASDGHRRVDRPLRGIMP